MIKIELKNSETTYYKKVTKHDIQVSDKLVRVYEWIEQDNVANEYDNDIEIDEQDKEKLDDKEYDALIGFLEDFNPTLEKDTITFHCAGCDINEEWTAEEIADKGTPVCPKCDEDMIH